MPISTSFEIYQNYHKPTYRCVVQKHLNYDFTYNINPDGIVTDSRRIAFNIEQLSSAEAKCQDGACKYPLCNLPVKRFTTCCFEWSNHYEDPTPTILRGKRVDVSEDGVVSFHDVVVKESNLDVNWRRLRNMARPIVDEALGRLAIDGGWRNTPMKIQLGSMLVDQKKVRVCARS